MAAYTTVDDPELFFQCKTYSGSSSDVTVTFDGTNDMQPDIVWLKKRGGTGDHLIYDSVRGTNKRLQPNSQDPEVDRSSNNDELKSFNSDGWTLGTFNSNVTGAGSTNVSWNWKESATAGLDIVSYTGTGVGRTISHNLSAVPDWMVVKDREANNRDWQVYAGDETDALALNNTDATGDSDVYWNDTAPTSSVFSVKFGATNTDGEEHIAYIFTSVQGYSKMGFYHGNGNVDGTFIHLGFRPAWFMIKRTNANEQWEVVDNKRSVDNPVNDVLVPNDDVAEVAAVTGNRIYCDFCSNGVKLRGNASSANESGGIFFYVAFAEQPFVNSNGVPNNAR